MDEARWWFPYTPGDAPVQVPVTTQGNRRVPTLYGYVQMVSPPKSPCPAIKRDAVLFT